MKELIATFIIGVGLGVFLASMIKETQSNVRPCIEAAAKGYMLLECQKYHE